MSKVCGIMNLSKNDEVIYKHFPIHAIKNSHKIIYRENNIRVTIFLSDNKIEMERKHSEYKINMFFEPNKISEGNYFIEELGRTIPLQTETNVLYYDDKKIELEYVLSMSGEKVGQFQFSLELEV